ncbi:hypothetical protein QTP88_011442 [Uroleucon formosanum]
MNLTSTSERQDDIRRMFNHCAVVDDHLFACTSFGESSGFYLYGGVTGDVRVQDKLTWPIPTSGGGKGAQYFRKIALTKD